MPKAHVYLYVLVALSCVYGVMSFDRDTNSTTRAATNNSDHTSQPQGTNLTDSSPEDYSSTVSTKPTEDDNNVSDTLENENDTSTTVSQDEDDHTDENITPTTHSQSTTTATTHSQSTSEDVTFSRPHTRPVTHIISTTAKASTTPVGKTEATDGGGAQGLGVAFLIIILIIVIALAVILYILWKKGRSYSFDLTNTGNDHDTPLRSMEHGGTFEQTSKECDQEEKTHETNSTANGCAGETPKQAASSERQNVPEEDSFMSDTSLTPPMKKVEFNLDLDLISGEPEPEAEPNDSQQNENNNNFTSTGIDSLDLFTEINLDEPQ
ncbi:uncharacterized protein LOC118823036 isoform X2 [Colossoma macropomum]|uniref:uncharacterized protein LOC118823036 isoform X2 n=1 Tax=Colossoma macropomum TaxID=42526 RepID=UPI001864ACF7|nr:uncharacterized protein LOC118823036 isoform X2 [Colossoma macropomum]